MIKRNGDKSSMKETISTNPISLITCLTGGWTDKRAANWRTIWLLYTIILQKWVEVWILLGYMYYNNHKLFPIANIFKRRNGSHNFKYERNTRNSRVAIIIKRLTKICHEKKKHSYNTKTTHNMKKVMIHNMHMVAW